MLQAVVQRMRDVGGADVEAHEISCQYMDLPIRRVRHLHVRNSLNHADVQCIGYRFVGRTIGGRYGSIVLPSIARISCTPHIHRYATPLT